MRHPEGQQDPFIPGEHRGVREVGAAALLASQKLSDVGELTRLLGENPPPDRV